MLLMITRNAFASAKCAHKPFNTPILSLLFGRMLIASSIKLFKNKVSRDKPNDGRLWIISIKGFSVLQMSPRSQR